MKPGNSDTARGSESTKTKLHSKDFRVRPGEKVTLHKWPPTLKAICKSKKQYQKFLKANEEELSVLQKLDGTISIDVTKHGIDKAYGMQKLRVTLGLAIDEMIFIGGMLAVRRIFAY